MFDYQVTESGVKSGCHAYPVPLGTLLTSQSLGFLIWKTGINIIAYLIRICCEE